VVPTAGCTEVGLADFSISQNAVSPKISAAASYSVDSFDEISPVQADTPSSNSIANLSETIKLASQIISLKYDVVTTAPGLPSITAKVFLKKNRMRMESSTQGTNTVTLSDPGLQAVYFYLPAMNMAIKMDWSQLPDSAISDVQSILINQPVINGTETIDNKSCLIVEYTAESVIYKIWVWQQNGLPLKMTSTSSSGQTTVEFKNFEFSDIADSLFELPADTLVTRLGLPPGTQPTGTSKNNPTDLFNYPTNLSKFY
jgi:outer membrane lipoprotein-sorting protein